MTQGSEAVDSIEFCWIGRGNRSVWATEEEARRDAVEMKQDGARIQRRRVVISEWEDVDDGDSTCIVKGCTEPDPHDFVRVTRGGQALVHLRDDEPDDE